MIAGSRLMPAGIAPAFRRFAENSRMSAVVMLFNVRPPKTGVRCSVIRRSRSSFDFFRFTV